MQGERGPTRIRLAGAADGCPNSVPSEKWGRKMIGRKIEEEHKFVSTPGRIEVDRGHVGVYDDNRSHIPFLKEAKFDQPGDKATGTGGKRVRLEFPQS